LQQTGIKVVAIKPSITPKTAPKGMVKKIEIIAKNILAGGDKL
jgi:hypothetical protein